jgi:hypothetical protein
MTTPVPTDAEAIDAEALGADRAAALADLQAKAALYARVSRAAAAERDPRVAVGAAWATDVLHVQELLSERAPAEEEQAQRRVRAVATAIAAAVWGATDTPETGRARDARELVVTARRRLLGVFDAPAAALIAERLHDLEHLAELPPPTAVALGPASPAARPATSPASSLYVRSRGIDPLDLMAELRIAAADGRVVADALLEAGYRGDAARQACLADLADVEAYLVEASVAAGDADLLLADVRRAAVVLLLSEAADRPSDVAAARAGVWAVVCAALPPAEVERLAPRLGRSPDALAATEVVEAPAPSAVPADSAPGTAA